MLLLIDNYDSFTYNLAQYLGELGEDVHVERNDAVDVATIEAWHPDRIVISPGPGTPDDAGISMKVIERFAGRVPILGVCLGHQAIGQVFGGRVVRAEHLMHGKVSKIFHDEKGTLSGVPNPFTATRYHSLLVERRSLPRELQVTAKTWEEEVMGLRHVQFAGTGTPLEGVQFHPESIMTREGKRVLHNFLEASRRQGDAAE